MCLAKKYYLDSKAHPLHHLGVVDTDPWIHFRVLPDTDASIAPTFDATPCPLVQMDRHSSKTRIARRHFQPLIQHAHNRPSGLIHRNPGHESWSAPETTDPTRNPPDARGSRYTRPPDRCSDRLLKHRPPCAGPACGAGWPP